MGSSSKAKRSSRPRKSDPIHKLIAAERLAYRRYRRAREGSEAECRAEAAWNSTTSDVYKAGRPTTPEGRRALFWWLKSQMEDSGMEPHHWRLLARCCIG